MMPTKMLGGLLRQEIATNGYILTRAIHEKVGEAKAKARQKPGKKCIEILEQKLVLGLVPALVWKVLPVLLHRYQI